MARSKKAKARKSSRNTHTSGQQSYLSMQQEARNTEVRNLWRVDVQFRHQAVQFVSAGSLKPAHDSTTKPISQITPEIEEYPIKKPGHAPASPITTENKPDSNPASECETTTTPVPPVRLRSPTPEDSSEDEVVFRGRRGKIEWTSCFGVQKGVIDSNAEVELDKASSSSASESELAADDSADSLWQGPPRAPSPSYVQIINATNNRPEISDEDDILADYIANIDEGSEDEDSSPSSPTQGPPTKKDGCTNPAGLLNLDDLSSNSESEEMQSDYHEISSTVELEDEARFVFSGRSQSDGKTRGKDIFASATAFADALESDPYYGFDIMDFSRPSLRKKKKQGLYNLDTLDSELENELINASNNDRLKKKSKKREREELRSQGLLGRRKKDPDLKTKYADGIGIEDLKSEIRAFILSPRNSLSLPPMTKHRRILVHDVAHALRLTSQSRGKGSSRFPVLSKTSRTQIYTHSTISQLDRILSKERFSFRSLKAWDKSGGRSAKAKRGNGAVSYMDGDVVGASAPEIGAGNKGRAMLEKMGWSTGTALGATHNKGILLPVPQVVKNSKAGLG